MANRYVCDGCGATTRDHALRGKYHAGCCNAGQWLHDVTPNAVRCDRCGEVDQCASLNGLEHELCGGGRWRPICQVPANGPTPPAEAPVALCFHCGAPNEYVRSEKPYICRPCSQAWERRVAFKNKFGVDANAARKALGL